MNLRFQKNAGYVRMVAVFGEKSIRFPKYPATCGRGLNLLKLMLLRINIDEFLTLSCLFHCVMLN